MFDVGVTLGNRYLLVTLVARGGMGEVWSAQDIVLDRRVAVKVLLPNFAGDPGFAARFRAEARAMAALSHPGIIEIYDYGQQGELAYLVMQFVDGESLVSLIRRSGPLAPERAMRLVIQAAEAIEAAHRQGIVHRDVKPANLLLRNDGRLALTDFGIARILATDRLTGADQIVGTSSYLAPEQVTGAEIGPTTDVYALGVVAYELLAGGKPFTADTPFGVALKHVHEQPPPLPQSVPEPIRELVSRAMAKDPAERWPSAAALAQAASAAIGEPAPTRTAGVMPSRPTVREPTAVGDPAVWEALTGEATRTTRRAAAGWERLGGKAPGRHRLALAGGGAAVLAMAAVLIVIFSPDGAGNSQTQGPEASRSAAAVAPAPSTAPAATPSSGTRSSAPTTTTAAAANPARTTPGAASSPPPATATVPNMYGWTENEMKSEITRLGLLHHITYEWTPDQCYVIRHTPTSGTVVPTGSTVNVVIAKATGICKQV